MISEHLLPEEELEVKKILESFKDETQLRELKSYLLMPERFDRLKKSNIDASWLAYQIFINKPK